MATNKQKILWIDDEIEMLKPLIIYLSKYYEVISSTNATDALDILKNEIVDLVLLDENMPGLRGLDALLEIKKIRSYVPVIMITKSEEEEIMEQAIGKNISDYLVKPVKPAQLLSTIKKNLNKSQLIKNQTTQDYIREFRKLSADISSASTFEEWIEIYKEIVYWDILSEQMSDELKEILANQKEDANINFANFIKSNYINWITNNDLRPLMSQTILNKKLFPHLKTNKPNVLILIDNLRYDHWKALSSIITNYFKIKEETLFFSILPTTTQYSRNSIFSGLMPLDLKNKYPQYWYDDEENEHKNMYEAELLKENLRRNGLNTNFYFRKIFNNDYAQKVNSEINLISNTNFSIIIYNFIDILSHKQTKNETLKELASNEQSYRSLSTSWFKNSPIHSLFKLLAENEANVFLTTDHGSILIKNPIKLIGFKETSTNLRYKQGRSLTYDSRSVFEISDPKKFHLPAPHPSTRYIFATNNDFFVYKNNYNQYVNFYKNSFQHGGISMEEMIIPFISLIPK